MKQHKSMLVGILGTIIIHLIAAILFMSVKLSSVYHEKSSEFLVEFIEDKDFINEEVIEAPLSLEELFENDDRFRDIVRNIANQDIANIDPDEYVDLVKDELIASGLLSDDNFIDNNKNQPEDMDAGDTSMELSEDDKSKKEVEEEISSNELAAMYQGETRISYFLENRYHLELPIPIYKCKGAGVVVLQIEVNQHGNITNIVLDNIESTAVDPCLHEAAIKSARRTRFNAQTSAPKKQAGTITYHFVAQ